MCLIKLVPGKDVFAKCYSYRFQERFDFHMFPLTCHEYVAVMRDQVEQIKRVRFSAAAVGIGEECKDEEKCQIASANGGNFKSRGDV